MVMLPALLAAGPLMAAGAYFLPHGLVPLERRALASRCRRARALVLSYDDGPGSELTPQLLDLLSSHTARATFFLLGARAEEHPAVVDRLVAGGHEIGCHGYAHLHAWRSGPGRLASNIERGYRALQRWPRERRLFRPPYGKTCLATRLAVRRREGRLGWWTIDSGDTAAALPDPASVVEKMTRQGGGVVLLHDFDRSPTRARFVLSLTDQLLRSAREQALTVCPLGELPA